MTLKVVLEVINLEGNAQGHLFSEEGFGSGALYGRNYGSLIGCIILKIQKFGYLAVFELFDPQN